MTFEKFKFAVSNQIDRMLSLSTELFYVEIDKDELFSLYLESFPEGKNKIYRERTVHNCSSCRSFIRNFGHVVAVINGRIETIWDIQSNSFYDKIAEILSENIKSRTIAGIYRHNNKTVGAIENRETLKNGIINVYSHFYHNLPRRLISKDLAIFHGNSQANKSVLERSLNEITLEASELVVDLIEQKSLYRGEEFLSIVERFQTIKREFDLLPKSDRDMFVWATSASIKEMGRFKNTVIGTLLYDISIGTDLEIAVKKFESKVAPSNYKRPTALITQGMINKAQEKITELGIDKSLERRYATTKDLTVNNVLFANKSTKKKMKKTKKKGVLADIKPSKNVDPDKAHKITIDDFVNNILPYAESVEMMVNNSHVNNLMSIIAPVNPRSPNIMKWDNPFSWSYNGEMTDSIIKQRVKKAGGNTSGFMRFSLSWDYYDDLDIHIIEPNGNEIHYANKGNRYDGNGFLDVDMNVQPNTLEPVENIAWENSDKIKEGKYEVFVFNYTKRDNRSKGFKMEMEIDGGLSLFTYNKTLKQSEKVQVMEFEYSHKKGMRIVNSLPLTSTSKKIWGIDTQEWTKVEMILNSPNHWNGERTGNKHFFFILDNCLNPDKSRGFYNEFLRNDLVEHRKVLEVLSSKMKTERSDKQLSGVGFSSTQENSILCRVRGKFEQIVMVTFANITGRFDKTKFIGGVLQGDSIVQTEEIGKCEVCKRVILDVDSRLPCPVCINIFHTSHFLESVRVSGKCPLCRESVTQHQIDKIVQLATV